MCKKVGLVLEDVVEAFADGGCTMLLLNLVYLVSYLASTYLFTYFVRLLTFINACYLWTFSDCPVW